MTDLKVDEHEARAMRHHLARDASQHLLQITGSGLVAQVDEPDRLVDLAAVEEAELLLVAQHLARRAAPSNRFPGDQTP